MNPPVLRSSPPAAQRRSGSYEPLRHLSTGAEGTAALARSSATSEVVEIRRATVARNDPERWRAIEAEAKAYALLEHPSWRRLVEIGDDDGTPRLVFEALDEASMAERLAGAGLARAEAWRIWKELVPAVAEAHRLGLVHGRIGPSAIRLRRDGTPVLDFPWLEVGAPSSPLDAPCEPPEAGVEPLDTSSDVYALGALLRVLVGDGALEAADEIVALSRDLTRLERDERPTLESVCRALVPAPPAALARVRPGARVGRYRLVSKLGEGGMGEVYRAVDLADGTDAALKVLRPEASADPASRRRFRKEARILSQIKSPYVANLIEINHDAGIDFLALEFVDGDNLDVILDARSGRLPEGEALAIVADICRGLVEAHANGIVHRDIKPQNILIARSRQAPKASDRAPGASAATGVKLCDFGSRARSRVTAIRSASPRRSSSSVRRSSWRPSSARATCSRRRPTSTRWERRSSSSSPAARRSRGRRLARCSSRRPRSARRSSTISRRR